MLFGVMGNFKCVLFDCDGVLVDSEMLVNRMLVGELSLYGLDFAAAEVGRLFTGGTMLGVMQTARGMGADLPDDWLDLIYEKIFAELAEHCDIVEGVGGMLDQLDAAGVVYATCSNGPMAKMKVTL